MFKRVLVANRAEIANRIIKTLKDMGIESVAIYSEADKNSSFVMNADISVALNSNLLSESYLDIDKIIAIAKEQEVDAIHPGYGFLSENVAFVEKCESNNIVFVGPTSAQIRDFGLKHIARDIAKKCEVPLLEGTDLIFSQKEALQNAHNIGYPVMLKSTAGGGGIGMKLCFNDEELSKAFVSVIDLATNNFGNSGVFLEKYIQKARHIEVQIFGDGKGNIAVLGERDCSIQRRNQKVIEETPAPNISNALRGQLFDCSKKLAQEILYKSAGTVEYIYDSENDKFYFLEVNTRLQVEHGITEVVNNVDLVAWMIKLASGDNSDILAYQYTPKGHAIEVRVYAEDTHKNFQPSTGLITKVVFDTACRCDTWIEDGSVVSSLYDPLLAKIIIYDNNRKSCNQKLLKVLYNTKIYGLESNLEFLKSIASADFFKNSQYFTKVLDDFNYNAPKVDVLKSGTMTTIQDFRGRLGFWNVGIPPSGAMDNATPRVLNKLLSNSENASFIEMTFMGASFKFRQECTVAIGGADMQATLNKKPIGMYKPIKISAHDVLEFDKIKGEGHRTYLVIKDGFDVASFLGSAATFTLGKFGGHGGRALQTGDVINFFKQKEFVSNFETPKSIPILVSEYEIGVIYGPHGAPEFFLDEYIEKLFDISWEVHFDSSRTGVRLIGPSPKWAREDGGDAGLHPSNIHDNAYAFGTLDFTGDMPIILGPDGPSLGGFVCPVTVISSELYKVGQLKAGDKIKFIPLSISEADKLNQDYEIAFANNSPLPQINHYQSIKNNIAEHTPIIRQLKFDELDIDITVRVAGDRFILIEAGELKLDIELRFFIHALMKFYEEKNLDGIIDITPGIRSLQIHFNSKRILRDKILKLLDEALCTLEGIARLEVESRTVWLPLSWNDPKIQLAIKKYQQGVRSNAPWCPSNIEFIRRINAVQSVDAVKEIIFNADYLVMGLGDVYLGAPVATPLDPTHRFVTTKYNPARTWTPQNAVGIGGAYMCVYGMEGPGGYQLFGRTLQMWNSFKKTKEFEKPWLLRFFDIVKFYPVSDNELLEIRSKFLFGKYQLKIEKGIFNLESYKTLLALKKDEIEIFNKKRQKAFSDEKAMWKAKGLDSFQSEGLHQESKEEIALEKGEVIVESIMSGNVWKIISKIGDFVQEGDTIVILESMKMEVEIEATLSGTISKILIKEGDNIERAQALVVIKGDAS